MIYYIDTTHESSRCERQEADMGEERKNIILIEQFSIKIALWTFRYLCKRDLRIHSPSALHLFRGPRPWRGWMLPYDEDKFIHGSAIVLDGITLLGGGRKAPSKNEYNYSGFFHRAGQKDSDFLWRHPPRRKKNFMKMEGKIFVARRSLLFFVLQVRQCRNDKMSLRNGAAAAKKKAEKREAHERRQRRGREKSSLILIDASLSTAWIFIYIWYCFERYFFPSLLCFSNASLLARFFLRGKK